jgi:hypothetical protein
MRALLLMIEWGLYFGIFGTIWFFLPEALQLPWWKSLILSFLVCSYGISVSIRYQWKRDNG